MLPNLPRDARFSPDHLWVRVEGDLATVGICPRLAGEEGPITGFILPRPGDAMGFERPLATLGGARGALELPSPVSGDTLEVNGELVEDPSLAEEDPFGDGWLVRISLDRPEEAEALMSSDQYLDYLSSADGGGGGS